MDIILITFLTFFASVIGTLGGFGANTIMVAVLSIYYPLPLVLLFVGIIHWLDDLWKMILFQEGILWPLVLFFGIPGVAASFLGARMTLSLPEGPILRLLGLILLVYAAYLIINPVFRLTQTVTTAAAGGVVSGFLAGILGVGGAARGAFLAVFDLPKAVYIATSGAIAILIDSSRLVTYYSGGVHLTNTLAAGFILFIPASLTGAMAAKFLADFIPQSRYRSFIAILLLLVGLKFLLFGS